MDQVFEIWILLLLDCTYSNPQWNRSEINFYWRRFWFKL